MTDLPEDVWQLSFGMMDTVYGPTYSQGSMREQERTPLIEEIVTNLFGKVWAQPGLSIRDKRLLVIGATTMLGRGDLIAVQVEGGLANAELSETQLEEMCVLMLFYAGVGNATTLYRGIQNARANFKNKQQAEQAPAAAPPNQHHEN